MPDIKIKAFDSLFFRDSRPFTMGEDNIAANLFPQIPGSALLGAFRTAYAAENNIPIEEIREKTASVNITYMGIMLDNEPVFPIPADCISIGDTMIQLNLVENENSSSPFPKLLIANTTGKIKDLSAYRFKENDLVNYWLKPSEIQLKHLSLLNEYYTYEPKIGIARNKDTRMSREGALYRVNMVKTEGKSKQKQTQFFAGIHGIELPAQGFVRLGGEGKAAYYEVISLSQPATPNWKAHNKGFKCYLATPAIFKQGFLPEWMDPETLQGEVAGYKIKLETTAFGRFIPYGGFDLELNEPKPVYKAIPAGAVYYFTCVDERQNEQAYNAIKNYFQQKFFF
jgi:CRISPR-associated protein Cmr3